MFRLRRNICDMRREVKKGKPPSHADDFLRTGFPLFHDSIYKVIARTGGKPHDEGKSVIVDRRASDALRGDDGPSRSQQSRPSAPHKLFCDPPRKTAVGCNLSKKRKHDSGHRLHVIRSYHVPRPENADIECLGSQVQPSAEPCADAHGSSVRHDLFDPLFYAGEVHFFDGSYQPCRIEAVVPNACE